jgi:hypothetical protein
VFTSNFFKHKIAPPFAPQYVSKLFPLEIRNGKIAGGLNDDSPVVVPGDIVQIRFGGMSNVIVAAAKVTMKEKEFRRNPLSNTDGGISGTDIGRLREEAKNAVEVDCESLFRKFSADGSVSAVVPKVVDAHG